MKTEHRDAEKDGKRKVDISSLNLDFLFPQDEIAAGLREQIATLKLNIEQIQTREEVSAKVDCTRFQLVPAGCSTKDSFLGNTTTKRIIGGAHK